MDKLPEPEFGRDQNWPRLLTGTEPLLAEGKRSSMKWFAALSAISIFRYWREVTFYKKNYQQSAFFFAGFLFASYQIAHLINEDPYILAAEENNKREEKFISDYVNLYKNARGKGLIVPGEFLA